MSNGDITSHEQVHFEPSRQNTKGDPLRMVMGKLVLDTYLADGYELDLSADIVNLLKIAVENVGGIVYRYDYTNQKLMAYYGDWNDSTSAGKELKEVANGDGGGTVRYQALGT